MHCRCFRHTPLSRRQMLQEAAGGFGAVALAAILGRRALAGEASGAQGLHHRPRARSVIFLYMDGGVSQVDSFDPKPLLHRDHGKPFSQRIEPTQFNNVGTTLESPWSFSRYGQSGLPVSELFPHVARHADDLAVIRSAVSSFSEHQTANFFLHTGTGTQGRPSMGAWISYGLGTESRDLPDYIVLNGGLIPSGGIDNFGSGFLPAQYQATIVRPGADPVPNIRPLEETPSLQRRKLDFVRRIDEGVLERFGRADALESTIANYEKAFRMQAAVPDLVDLASEPESVRRLYGLDAPFEPTRIFAAQCLIARRLVERGVRFIELTCPATHGNDRWDAHSGLRKNHGENALAVDQPIGGLLSDLKSRGLLGETLVVWTGEFGRTPFAQGSDGRDHSPFGFSLWLAGGGAKGGTVYGATDDHGYRVVEGRVEIHDLHASMLHLLGVDHRRQTFRFSGRDMRLTDVHGEVIEAVIA